MAQIVSPSELVACLTGVRVQLNWNRMFDEQWKCSIIQLENECELSSLYMPWYVSNGEQTNYDCSGAEPVTVQCVAKNVSRWEQNRQDGIKAYAAQFQAAAAVTKQPIRVVLPAYRLPKKDEKSTWLLLDGNHRAVGLALASVSFEATLLSIDGPICKDALPDLRHWQCNGLE